MLSGTTVTLRGDGVPRTVYSDERGDFELSGGIAPGTYTLTVSLTGFSDATVNDVVVSDGVVVLPEVVLQLASFGDTVVVTRIAKRGPADRCAGVDVGHLHRHA